MHTKISILFSLYIVTVSVIKAICLEYPSLGFYKAQCPENTSVFYACDQDCRENHGALYGFCGRKTDYSCYCGRPHGLTNPKSGQCRDRNNPHWDAICRFDCLCNHGGTDGRCNWQTKVCECLGQSFNMTLCPFATRDEFLSYVYAMGPSNSSNPEVFLKTNYTKKTFVKFGEK